VWRDRIRAYRVKIDGVQAGSLRAGETLDFAVSPGDHTVQVAIDWCTSPLREVRVGDGQTAQLTCRSGGSSWEIWQSLLTPGSYLRLEMVNSFGARSG
jgi:hypothetical protein